MLLMFASTKGKECFAVKGDIFIRLFCDEFGKSIKQIEPTNILHTMTAVNASMAKELKKKDEIQVLLIGEIQHRLVSPVIFK